MGDVPEAFLESFELELDLFPLDIKVDFVLEKTDRKSLSFIGRSHGTSAMFAALSNSTI